MTQILIPLAQGCEELEAVTLIDILRRAELNVTTAGLDAESVTASHGTVLIPDTTLDLALDHVPTQGFDLLILPGGLPGADILNDDARIHQLIKDMDAAGKYIAAICAAPKILARAGILDGKNATAYPGTLEAINLPTTTILNEAIVQDGNIITSRGPGTALDFALFLVELMTGKAKRNEVESALQR